MKVSEITNKELADYLRLEYADLSVTQKADLDVLLEIAKTYIKSYTGLEDVEVIGEVAGIGDGSETTFYVDYENVIADSQKIYIDGIEKVMTTDYTFDNGTGKIEFLSAPLLDETITADYKAWPSDKYKDFVIVVYVLVQDMYDNRTLYVDKNNLNKVVETILGMHSINLL
jgi:hypothetical protein